MNLRLRIAIWGLLSCSGGGMGAQNLILNPDFDADLSGWTVMGTGFVSHAAGAGSPVAPPGAVFFTFFTSTGWVEARVSQCVSIGEGPFDFGGRFNLSGSTNCAPAITLDFFSQPDCQGALLGSSGVFSGPSNEPGLPSSYFHWRRANVARPTGAVSARLTAGVSGFPELSGPAFANAHFDRLYLGPPGTTPVTLDSFAIE